jgi:thiol-activated cytolysin
MQLRSIVTTLLLAGGAAEAGAAQVQQSTPAAAAAVASNASQAPAIPPIRAYILGLSPPIVQASHVAHPAQETLVTENGATFLVRRTEHDVTETPDEIVAFQPNAGVIWPGALVQVGSLASGTPALISLPRGPAAITLQAGALAQTATVPAATPEAVLPAHQKLLEQVLAGGPIVPASISYQKVEMHSLEQAMLDLGISASWLTGSVKAAIGGSTGHDQNSVIVKLVQSYYTLSYSPPPFPEAVFDPGVTLADLQGSGTMGPGNPPAYISSVTFGRMLLFRVSATADFRKIEEAVDLARNVPGILGPAARERGELQQILNSSQVQMVAVGGGGAPALILATGRDLAGYLGAGANLTSASPGFPIAYTVRYLSNNQVARLGYPLHYATETRTPVQRRLTLSIDRIHVLGDCDAPGRGDGEFFWTFQLNKDVVSQRLAHNARTAGDDEDIPIGAVAQLPLTMQPGSRFTVSGVVREADVLVSDLVGEFADSYQFDNQEWNPGSHSAELGTGDCRATVFYRTSLSPLPTPGTGTR